MYGSTPDLNSNHQRDSFLRLGFIHADLLFNAIVFNDEVLWLQTENEFAGFVLYKRRHKNNVGLRAQRRNFLLVRELRRA